MLQAILADDGVVSGKVTAADILFLIATIVFAIAFVVRIMRDGVWYEGGVSGNTPMVWDSVNEKWTTPYNPDTWPDKGVQAGDNPDFYPPPTPTE